VLFTTYFLYVKVYLYESFLCVFVHGACMLKECVPFLLFFFFSFPNVVAATAAVGGVGECS